MLVFAVFCAPIFAQQDSGHRNSTLARNQILVIGRVSDNPKRDVPALKAMVDYAAAQLRDQGIVAGEVLVAPDNRFMVSYLRAGRVDWITETAGNALYLEQKASAERLVRTVRNNVSDYHSIIFVRSGSAIKKLSDLRGKTIAFQNSTSTSAYFLPLSELLAQIQTEVEFLATPLEKPNPKNIGIVFAQSEANISAWVQKGIVDAGAFSLGDWNNADYVPDSYRADLAIIHQTKSVPRALELVRGDLSASLKTALANVLLGANQSDSGKVALKTFLNSTRFMPMDSQGAIDLARLQKDLKQLDGLVP